MQAKIAAAKGAASRIVEDGRATSTALAAQLVTWKQGGDNARDIFLTQRLQVLLDQLVSTIGSVKVNRVTLLPADRGVSARSALSVAEEIKGATGIDVGGLVEKFSKP
jgi:flotillin